MSGSVVECWSLRDKLIHWDKGFSLCEFQEKDLCVAYVDPVEAFSTKCVGRKEFRSYLNLSLFEERILQEENYYRELRLVQDYQVLKWYGGLSYLRHFPNDRCMPGLGFGSKRFEVKAKLGRGAEVKRHLEQFRFKQAGIYCKYIAPALKK